MFEHDGDGTGTIAGGLFHPDRHAQIGGHRELDGHLDAAHRAVDDDALSGHSTDRLRSSAALSLTSNRSGRENGSSRSTRLDPAGMALPMVA